jgi:hypothetical protein
MVVPGVSAKANPDVVPMLATLGLLLAHVPPGVPVVKNKFTAPAHKEAGPIMVPGLDAATTVTLYGNDTSNPQLLST